MQWFNQLRVTTKLIVGFLVVSVIGAAMGLLGVVNMGRMAEWTGKIYNDDLQALKASRMATSTSSMPAAPRSACCPRRPWASARPKKELIEKSLATVDERIRKAVFVQPEGQATVAVRYADAGLPRAYGQVCRDGGQAATGHVAVRQPVFTESAELIKASHALEDLMAKMVKRRDERARANMDEARGVYDATRVWMLALVLGGLAVSVLLGYVIARLLSRQLGGEPGYAVAIARASPPAISPRQSRSAPATRAARCMR